MYTSMTYDAVRNGARHDLVRSSSDPSARVTSPWEESRRGTTATFLPSSRTLSPPARAVPINKSIYTWHVRLLIVSC